MIIGILKEKPYERRVSMQPASISSLIQKKKVRVLIEKSAGDAAFLPDKDYDGIADGIVDYEQLVEQSDLLVRISTPDDDLMGRMRSNQILVGVLNPLCNMPLVKKLLNHKITAFSMDMVPRTTRAQSMDVLSSMATVAGYKAVLDAAMHLPHFFPMFMTAAGTIAPAKVLVIGAGVAGLQAIATARKLGARVEAFEKRQAQVIHEHAVKSDVVICSAQIPGKWAPRILKKETVQAMSSGSVIVDLAASSGGNCELTERYKNIVYNQVTIIGNTSYTSTLQADASKMFGHNVMNFLDLLIDDEGNLNLNFEDEVIRESCVSHNGEYVSKRIKEFYTESA
ncbi:MAG: NAD(P) transhydrogenase subunit alpha [Bacteroidales bacterium]